jgi:histone acetyltransferase (RNA polymerase elongator complex component)
MNELTVLAHHDTQLILKVLATLVILEYDLDQLEYTGKFNSQTSENCIESIAMIRQNVLKKLIQ